MRHMGLKVCKRWATRALASAWDIWNQLLDEACQDAKHAEHLNHLQRLRSTTALLRWNLHCARARHGRNAAAHEAQVALLTERAERLGWEADANGLKAQGLASALEALSRQHQSLHELQVHPRPRFSLCLHAQSSSSHCLAHTFACLCHALHARTLLATHKRTRARTHTYTHTFPRAYFLRCSLLKIGRAAGCSESTSRCSSQASSQECSASGSPPPSPRPGRCHSTLLPHTLSLHLA